MKQLSARGYQEAIVDTARLYNTLVVLPTGLGKTHIAMLLAKERIKQYPKEKVVVLAPTRPLVEQHADSFASFLPDAGGLGTILTGRTKPEKRAEEFASSTYIFSTPQTLENDLLSRRVDLSDVCMLVVDEAHRAVGDYAYVYICEQYAKQANHERLLGLTASPGSDKATIKEVIANIKAERVEVRSADDPDVKPYVQQMDVHFDEIELTDEITTLRQIMKRVVDSRLSQLKRAGAINDTKISKKKLLMAQRQLQAQLKGGNPPPTVWTSLSVLAEVMKAQHALDLIETQGIEALLSYIKQMRLHADRGQSKAVQNLVADPDMKAVEVKAASLRLRGVEHPKFVRLLSRVKLEQSMNPGAKIIVFSQFRDTASRLAKAVGPNARLFVGQQKKGDTGMSQKEQKAMLEDFREGEFPVLVATSVGEEGLDIPSVDLVIFYEPVPSAIRTIQRRGRTGRQESGRVVVLVTLDTRDVIYRWAAFHKEKRMYRALKEIAHEVEPLQPKKDDKQQASLDSFSDDALMIYADSREKGGAVLKELQNLGVDLTLKSLDVGDYVLSSRVAVEFKTAGDFVDSMLDGRLLSQMRSLTQYQRPLVIVQGSNWYEQRKVHPNAIRGMMSAIAVSYGVPILVTQNEKDTAALLYTIARREKEGGSGEAEFARSTPGSQAHLLLSTVASLPNVGPVMAPKLLARFGTLKELVNASIEQLCEIDGVGKKTARLLVDFFEQKAED